MLYTNTLRLKKKQEGDLGPGVLKRILALRKPKERESDFARRIDVSPQVMNNWTKGRQNTVSVDVLADVVRATGVSADHLLLGKLPAERHGEARDAIEEIGAIVDRIRRLVPVTKPTTGQPAILDDAIDAAISHKDFAEDPPTPSATKPADSAGSDPHHPAKKAAGRRNRAG